MNGTKVTLNIDGDRANLIPLGDIHYGSKYCNYKAVNEWIEWIRRAPDTFVFLMGDMMESATVDFSPAGAVFEQDKDAQEQFDDLVELLKPISSQIIGSVVSNHENRFYKVGGLDVIKLMSDRLGIPYYGELAYLDIKVKRRNIEEGRTYRTVAFHGGSNSTNRAGKMNALSRLTNCIDADLYMMGHTHEKAFQEIPTLTLDTTSKEIMSRGVFRKKKLLVLTGGFLDWGGYAALKGLPPTSIGCPKIELFSEKWDIHVSL